MTRSPDQELSPLALDAPPRTRAARAVESVKRGFAEVVGPRRGVQPLEPGILRKVLMLWLVGRVVSFTFLAVFFVMSRAGGWGFGPGGVRVRSFLEFLAGWDADRYSTIAMGGYPPFIALNEFGDVIPNNWAFMPVFPFLGRALTQVTGMPWALSGVLISVAASAGATLLLFLLLREVAPPRQAWWAVVFFTFAPLSFTYSLAYAESLFLLLVFAALLLTVRRQYHWLPLIGLAAAFTRPGALALSLALGFVFAVRFLRRKVDPFPIAQAVWLFVGGVGTAAAGLSWPLIAEHVTGFEHAYVRTETAWWIPYVGRGDFVPLTPWFRFAGTYLGIIGIVLVLAIMAAFVWWITSAQIRRLGIEVAGFGLAYGLYLFAVFLPQQSLFRLLLPMSPLLADERLSGSRRRRMWLLGACIVLQAAAVLLLWTIGYP